ncbi:hypothetical protein KKH43_04465 [Patescibacteria group bacterium]|nr:hypothetical protein [Patescibacteria group bacterium]
MLDVKQVKKYSDIVSEKEDIVSLYLNADQSVRTTEEIRIELKDLLRVVEERGLTKDAKKIDDYLKQDLMRSIRSLMFIASDAQGIFDVLRLPVPVVDQVSVSNKVNVTPLCRMLDEYERYAVIMIDKEKMRLFTVYMGEIEEHDTDALSYFPGHHKKGGWSQARFQRHIEDHTNSMIKDTVKAITRYEKDYPFDRLIIGGSKEVLPEFEKMLPKNLQSKVAGKLSLEMFVSDHDVLEESMRIEEQIEREKEEDLVKRLVDNLGEGNKAVRGMDKVLLMLEEGKAMEIVIDEELEETGKKCTKCDHLALDELKCSYCGGDMEILPDLISEIVNKALNSNVEIEFVRGSDLLKENKSIGAFLRF